MSEENPIPQAEAPAETPAPPLSKIIAKPSNWFRGKRILLALGMIYWGGLSIRDGFYRYPAENKAIEEQERNLPAKKSQINAFYAGKENEATADRTKLEEARKKALADTEIKLTRHPAFDIPFNQAFGVILPPLGLAFIVWTMYQSRGVYELDGETLSMPGHPPIPLSSIQTVDRRKWDRKGIAIVEYSTGEKAGKFKLDDFIYDRDPTDEIFKRIEIAVTSPG